MLMCGHNTPDIVDFLGQFVFDSILIEGEHGPVDFGYISDLRRTCALVADTGITITIMMPDKGTKVE